jgi:hypothetical protein
VEIEAKGIAKGTAKGIAKGRGPTDNYLVVSSIFSSPS